MNKIPIIMEDTSMEILARIAKSEAGKYNCSMHIDYSGTNRNITFAGDMTGNTECAGKILESVKNIFRK
ncbi:MAG: hypothetical protein V2I97_12955 [Desulfococcaceae bacterium]|jgi:hypothetical protein|nr:hypothetical protein [Desulfococcaceae bacterium]